MTDVEFAKIALLMKEMYPKENLFPTDHSQETWFQMLKDLPYDVVSTGLVKWASTQRWSPSIADLRRLSFEVSNPEIKTWDEAWETVMQAIRRYGYNRRIEALDTFDEITRKAVNRIGWIQICTSEEIGIERAAFRDIYKALSDKTKTDGQMATSVKKVIEATRNKRLEQAVSAETKKLTDNTVHVEEKASADISESVQGKLDQLKERLKNR